MWLNRVEKNFSSAQVPTFLDGIAEIDTAVLESGSGSVSEANIIHIPVTEFEPDILINNTTYPIALQAYDDNEIIISLDKYQSKVVTLTDDQAIGASYPRIDAATSSITTALLKKKYAKAIHAIAPDANTTDTPVSKTTGPAVSGGRKLFTYEDLVAQKDLADNLDWPEEARRACLSTTHWNDLLLDRKNFGNQLIDYAAGKPIPVIAGWELVKYIANPMFRGTNKLPFGAVKLAGDQQASVFFYVTNIAKKTGLTKQYFAASKDDPENQVNKLAYRHYFIVIPKCKKYISATVSDVAA